MEKNELHKKWWVNDYEGPVITYCGLTDWSMPIFLNDLAKNGNQLMSVIDKADSYGVLLNVNLFAGYYVLNLFWFFDDIEKVPEVEGNVHPNCLEDYQKSKVLYEKIKAKLKLKNFSNTVSIYQKWLSNNIYLADECFSNYGHVSSKNLFDVFKIEIALIDNEAEEICNFLDTKFWMYNSFINTKNKIIKNRFQKKMWNIENEMLSNFDFAIFSAFLDLLDWYLKLTKDNKKTKQILDLIKQILDSLLKINSDLTFQQHIFERVKKICYKSGFNKFFVFNFKKIFEKINDEIIANSSNFFEIPNSVPSIQNSSLIDSLIQKNRSIFYESEKKSSFFTFTNFSESLSINQITGAEFFDLGIQYVFNGWWPFVFKLTNEYFVEFNKKFTWFMSFLSFTEEETSFFKKRIEYIYSDFLNISSSKTQLNDAFEFSDKSLSIITTIEGILNGLYKQIQIYNDEKIPNLSLLLNERQLSITNGKYSFYPSKFFSNLLSDNAKKVLYYFLFIWNGNGTNRVPGNQRNVLAHGEYSTKNFAINSSYLNSFQCIIRLIDELINNLVGFVAEQVKNKFQVYFSIEQMDYFSSNPYLMNKFIDRIEKVYTEWGIDFDFNVLELLRKV